MRRSAADPDPDPGTPLRLSDAGRDYFARRATWERLAPAAVAIGARVALGRPRRGDAVAIAAATVAYPVLEWITHHHLLHALPFAGRAGDDSTPEYACHIVHHQHPDDVDLLFVRAEIVPKSIQLALGGSLLAAPATVIPLTGLATQLTLMNVYHWVHYLMHTPYRARGRWYRKVEENHLLHHRSPDETWRMGVLFAAGDRLVGARRRAADAPTSG